MTDDNPGLCFRTILDPEASPGEVEWALEHASDEELAMAQTWLEVEDDGGSRLEKVRLLTRQHAFAERYGRPRR